MSRHSQLMISLFQKHSVRVIEFSAKQMEATRFVPNFNHELQFHLINVQS